MNEMVPTSVTCSECKSHYDFMLPKSGVDKWHAGTPVRQAFPHATQEVWELLYSGVCSDCWNKEIKE